MGLLFFRFQIRPQLSEDFPFLVLRLNFGFRLVCFLILFFLVELLHEREYGVGEFRLADPPSLGELEPSIGKVEAIIRERHPHAANQVVAVRVDQRFTFVDDLAQDLVALERFVVVFEGSLATVEPEPACL